MLCGVCADEEVQLMLSPCRHSLCTACATQLRSSHAAACCSCCEPERRAPAPLLLRCIAEEFADKIRWASCARTALRVGLAVACAGVALVPLQHHGRPTASHAVGLAKRTRMPLAGSSFLSPPARRSYELARL